MSSSIPIKSKSISLQSLINSVLEILATVLLAPSSLDKKQVVKLVVSDVVKETTKSEFSTSASFNTEIEAALPSIVLMSSLFSAMFKLDFLLSIKVISWDSKESNFAK